MEFKRKRARIVVDIAVTLTTVLDSMDARIIDLSEHGAQIVGATMAKRAKFQIEYLGQTVYAQCMWSEIDRMGVRFPFAMSDGPLHDALMMASPSTPEYSGQALATMAPVTAASGYMPPPAGGIGLPGRRPMANFGRRTTS